MPLDEPGHPSRFKRRAKALIIRWELWWYGVTALLYFVAIPTTILLFPNVSNLWLSVLVLLGGFAGAVGSTASAIKSDDTIE
jgi:hypothetical protein